MSKHLKNKNPPVVSSDDDNSVTQDLLTPGAVDPFTGTTAGAVIVPETDGAGAPSSSPHADDGWQRVAEQLDSLRTVYLQLVTLVASSAGTDRPQDVSPRGNEQRPLQGILEGPPAIAAAGGLSAITHVMDATRQEAAI
ncbi:unnamed protein product [Lampetra planeri]